MIKENIKRILKEQGRTQAELCRELGTSTQNFQYYLRGNISLSTLAKIAEVLRVQPWQLLRPSDEIPQGETRATRTPQEFTPQEQPTPTAGAILCPYCLRPIVLHATAPSKAEQAGAENTKQTNLDIF